MIALTLTFSKAQQQDAEQLAALVNSAYRGEVSRQGWTTEVDLLDGRRTEAAELERLIADANSIILLCKHASELVGSIHLERNVEQVQFGMLAVNPSLQGRGIGKQLLQSAELAAQQAWPVNTFIMAVISSRHELIAFYERRGYRRTGITKAFPVNPALWTAKVADLQLEFLEKSVIDHP
ncbi:MAG: GNAT family N-acetyltransferase [Methylococcales bacterium]|nr:GNAT family N-acetyltransferase [Methylococcales bacterium]